MELYLKDTVTCAEMKELERMGDEAGLSYYQMMENAGTAAAKALTDYQDLEWEMAGEGAEKKTPGVMIFCGKGNNGGDGFVVARKLAEAGWKVDLVLVEGEPQTEDAKKNFEKLPSSVGVTEIWEVAEFVEMLRNASDISTDISYIVDAMYGTGFHGEIRRIGIIAVDAVNLLKEKTGAVVFSLDIPSGLAGDMTAEEAEGFFAKADPQTGYVSADCTICFHAKKPVHDLPQAAGAMGEIVVADIGLADVLK